MLFFTDADRLRYLADLRELCLATGCRVHAYVLMTNHVHLLLTPDAAGKVSALMQALGRRYVRYVNDRYGRTGTLWEGRFKSCLVGSDAHGLRCYSYIELNPLRAAMVADPADWPWSSYSANPLGQEDSLVWTHPNYKSLGSHTDQRAEAYRCLAAEAIDPAELEEIRAYLQRQQALGSPRFQAAIEAQLARRVTPGRPGRPRGTGRQRKKVL